MDIVNVYAELGSYRATAQVCGTTHRTVKQVLARRRAVQAVRAARAARWPVLPAYAPSGEPAGPNIRQSVAGYWCPPLIFA